MLDEACEEAGPRCTRLRRSCTQTAVDIARRLDVVSQAAQNCERFFSPCNFFFYIKMSAADDDSYWHDTEFVVDMKELFGTIRKKYDWKEVAPAVRQLIKMMLYPQPIFSEPFPETFLEFVLPENLAEADKFARKLYNKEKLGKLNKHTPPDWVYQAKIGRAHV